MTTEADIKRMLDAEEVEARAFAQFIRSLTHRDGRPLRLEAWQVTLIETTTKETHVESTTQEVRDFAVQAAQSTGQVPLAALQTALDEIDGELGRRMLLPEADRPEDTPELVRDVRAVRALQRYRLALEGLGS